MNNNFLIPANTKKGSLIFGLFRPVDLIILISGVITTFILAAIFQKQMNDLIVTILCLLPLLISAFLVIPVPHQHNILVTIGNINKFFTNRKQYYWRGWCFIDDKE